MDLYNLYYESLTLVNIQNCIFLNNFPIKFDFNRRDKQRENYIIILLGNPYIVGT